MGGTIGSEISSSPSDKYVADDPRSTPVGTNGRIITLGSEAVEEGERDITLLLYLGEIYSRPVVTVTSMEGPIPTAVEAATEHK